MGRSQLLAALLLLVIVPPIVGQPQPSHIPLPVEEGAEPGAQAREFEERIRERLDKRSAVDALKNPDLKRHLDLLKKFQPDLDPNNPDSLRKLLDNPTLRNMLRQALTQNEDVIKKQSGASAENLNALKKMLNLPTSKPPETERRPPPTKEVPPHPEQPDSPMSDGPPPRGHNSAQQAEPRSPTASSTTDARTNKIRGEVISWMMRTAERMQDRMPNLQKSEAFRDIMRDIDRFYESREPGGGDIAEYIAKIQDRLPSGETMAGLQRFVPKIDWSGIGNRLPSMPQINWSPPTPDMPSWTPSLPSTPADLWKPLVYVGGAVVLGYLLWKLWPSLPVPGAARWRARRWQLGAWPVDPARIQTRNELIAAFEYLALLVIGPTARNQNHLAIAAELGDQSLRRGDARQSATTVARLYEKARYAPDDDSEILPEEALRTARRDLCLLAGKSAP